ncbi:MAG: hypothetical protein IJZ36_01530, partial [Bacilli bacterium]|nr:hypothetical protein [Bacilli bacterium]
MVDLNVASEIDNIVMGYAIDNNKPITKDNDESVSVESADTLSKEVEEHCDDYNDLLDFLIMTTDITNLVRVTLYKDMIGIGFDNGKYRNIVVKNDLYNTIDFNKIVADNKPTNHITRLNIDKFILENICPGYDINGKINYLFDLIPSLTKIKVKGRELPFFRETYDEKKEQVNINEPLKKDML